MKPEIEPILPSQAGRPIVIAGPCSAETPEQVMTTAQQLSSLGIPVFRAGIWKPRTKPGGFEGVGAQGLRWLAEVKEKTGMKLATEVATKEHVRQALEAGVDILWIGARTSANPFAVQEIADALTGVDVPVLVKNPVNPDLELWIGALERIQRAGVRKLGAIHRGFSSAGKNIYRNLPQWYIPMELRRRLPGLTLLCDPSHIAGRRELVTPLCQQALDLGFDGFMIESHCTPETAWSDASQQVTPEALDYILSLLRLPVGDNDSENRRELLRKIEECDNDLIEMISQRLLSGAQRRAKEGKPEAQIFKLGPYRDILDQTSAQELMVKLAPDFLKKLSDLIKQVSETNP